MQTKLLFVAAFAILGFRSNAQWKPVNSGFTNLQVNVLVVNEKNIFAGTDNGVFLSNNNGGFWRAMNSGLTNTNVTSLVISGATIFAGTPSGVFFSTSSGENWTAINSGLTNRSVTSLLSIGSSVFAETSSGMFLSTDTDNPWKEIDSCVVRLNINSLAISGNNIFVGTRSVFLSTDKGHNWKPVNTGLPDFTFNSLAISGSYIFAASNGAGVFIRPLAEMIPVKDGNAARIFIPYVSIYPNPFSTITTLEIKENLDFYDVTTSKTESCKMDLFIYDLLGQEIKKIINNVGQKIIIERGDLSNGIYFYKLSKKNQLVATGKFIIE